MMYSRRIDSLKGIGPKKAEQLRHLGIKTTEDLIFHFPRSYQDRRKVTPIGELKEGENYLIHGRVVKITDTGFRRGRKRTVNIEIEDETGIIKAVFFNAAFLLKNIHEGESYFFYGKVSSWGSSLQMIHPEFSSEDIRGILPVYPLTSGITQGMLRYYTKQVLGESGVIEDYMPGDVLEEAELCTLEEAIASIHFPEGDAELERARKRLIYDDMYILQLGLRMMKSGENVTGNRMEANPSEYIDSLGFSLTKAQKKAAEEICADMGSAKHMNRLLQGDVGSGKTAVAEIALFKAVKSGFQAVFMAPTELLATQHYRSIRESFARFGIETVFLGGRMKASEKNEVLKSIASGKAQCIIGTHALLQSNVEFADLGLVITDEQHRFGVNQRTELWSKGNNPDIIVMTATPIPRTLAVVYFGDMDVSVIDEMPPGRQKVLTKAVTGKTRKQVYKFVEEEIAKGHRAYVVCPLIEESDDIEASSAEEVYEELKKDFPRAGLLHGEMKSDEKNAVMRDFATGQINLLVSTVVIEVGINVPEATVMIVENSERFGLAQLHQLRGRVGRGSDRSYCILILGSKGEIASERAKTMVESSDGFFIAERDLELRGPGEVFGSRQHGLPDLKLADISKNMNLLEPIRKQIDKGYVTEGLIARVEKLFGENPELNL